MMVRGPVAATQGTVGANPGFRAVDGRRSKFTALGAKQTPH
jgi:hypothetical protein